MTTFLWLLYVVTFQVADGLCQIQVVDASKSPVKVELMYDDQSGNSVKLSQDLIRKNLALSCSPSQAGASSKPEQKMVTPKNTASKPKQANQIQPAKVVKGSFQAVISWVNTPEDLYIQAVSADAQVMQDVSSYYKGASATLPTYRPLEGNVCTVLDRESGDWCRAVALKYVSKEKIKVMFVDYGNTDEVNCEHVRKLEDKFITDVPAVAMGCALDGATPAGSSWSKEATQLIFKVT